MLILKINDEREKIRKVKGVFRKRVFYESFSDVSRSTLNVNGKNVITLELPFSKINNEDVIKLLNIYKGRVLISEKYRETDSLREYIFSPKEYYQRAALSSLFNQMKIVNREWKTVGIKITEFVPFKELFRIVKISKSLIFITEENPMTDKFTNDCYYEFGAIVSVKREFNSEKCDVYLDLEEIDDKGKLMIQVKGKDFLLYPDVSYFQDNPEYQKLLHFNIDHNIICAAFSNK